MRNRSPIPHEDARLRRHPHLDLSDYFPYLINRVGAALVARFSADALDRRGLTIVMWRVLAALSNNGGQRQIDLSGFTSIDVSTLSRLVTRLIRMGLVTRTRSASNSREVVVELTAKGRAMVAEMIPVARDLQAIATRGIARKDLLGVKRALEQMYGNLAPTQPPGGKRRGGAKLEHRAGAGPA
jgi:MarR family transcriptional regulator, organic hydroperoxide resistance regulator